MMKKQKIVFVLGMHRSGTSAMMGVLNLLGVELGNRLLPRQQDNPKGFWEHADIVDVHERLLKILGSAWHDTGTLPLRWWERSEVISKFQQELVRIVQRDFSDLPMWGLKDPRLCRLLPVWDKVFEELSSQPGYVIVFRNPKETARSLEIRNGFPYDKSLLLWLRYILEAEKYSRGAKRVFVSYDKLLSDWQGVVDAIAQSLDLQWPVSLQDVESRIDSFLTPTLRHHVEDDDTTPVHYFAYEWVRTAYLSISDAQYRQTILSDLQHLFIAKNFFSDQILKDILLKDSSVGKHPLVYEQDALCRKLCSQLEILSKNYADNQHGILAMKAAQLDEKNKTIVELTALLDEKNDVINDIFSSKIWKVTFPVRWLGTRIKQLAYAVRSYCNGCIGEKKVRVGDSQQSIDKEQIITEKKRDQLPVPDVTEEDGLNIPEHKIDAEGDYARWLLLYDTLTDAKRTIIRQQIEMMEKKTIISVLMPVYNPPVALLDQAIRSVLGQLYQNWELCIADDASTDVEVKELLHHYREKDDRIKVIFRDSNGHISKASNSALELVSGEFVALLDHDDILPEGALYWVAREIEKYPEAMLLYSDEDKINEHGVRFDPYFKSDWNPDLFLSHNMFSHLGVYRAGLLKQIGGFRAGFEGAQDYDLVLRCMERVSADQIRHIPRILYHWRAHTGSTALAPNEKLYAMRAGEKAINDYLQRNGVTAIAEYVGYGYRVRYSCPEIPPLVSIIVPIKDGYELLRNCLDSIFERTDYKYYEIIVVDNGSDDPDTLEYFDAIRNNEKIHIIRDAAPFNFARLNNLAVKHARGDVLVLLNNDTEVISRGWLDEMVSHALRNEIGVVGAKLYYHNNTIQHAGVILGLDGIAGHAFKHLLRENYGYCGRLKLIQNYSAVTAACLAVRREVYEQVEGMDEELAVAFNDVDFCLRVLMAGYRNLWTPYAELYHYESISRGLDDTPEKSNRFMREINYMQEKWGWILANDPAYSPNLTLDYEDFSYAWPPRVQLITNYISR